MYIPERSTKFAIVRKSPCELNNVYAPPTAESRAKIWYQENAFKPPPPPPPPVAQAVVRSKAVVLLLLIRC